MLVVVVVVFVMLAVNVPGSHILSVLFHINPEPWVVEVELKDTSLRSAMDVALKSVRPPPPPLLATAPASHTPSVEFHTKACPSVVEAVLKEMSLRSFTLLLGLW